MQSVPLHLHLLLPTPHSLPLFLSSLLPKSPISKKKSKRWNFFGFFKGTLTNVVGHEEAGFGSIYDAFNVRNACQHDQERVFQIGPGESTRYGSHSCSVRTGFVRLGFVIMTSCLCSLLPICSFFCWLKVFKRSWTGSKISKLVAWSGSNRYEPAVETFEPLFLFLFFKIRTSNHQSVISTVCGWLIHSQIKTFQIPILHHRSGPHKSIDPTKISKHVTHLEFYHPCHFHDFNW